MWEFPKITSTFFWGPYNEHPTLYGTILGSPIFGNSHVDVAEGRAECTIKDDGQCRAQSFRD